MKETVYRLTDNARLRAEGFGLLFYDTLSTRLTFIDCGQLLKQTDFDGSWKISELAGDTLSDRNKIEKIVRKLKERGLVVAEE